MISFAEMGEATVTELKIRYFGIKERVKVAVSYLFLFIYVMSFLFLLPSFLLSFILFFSFFLLRQDHFLLQLPWLTTGLSSFLISSAVHIYDYFIYSFSFVSQSTGSLRIRI